MADWGCGVYHVCVRIDCERPFLFVTSIAENCVGLDLFFLSRLGLFSGVCAIRPKSVYAALGCVSTSVVPPWPGFGPLVSTSGFLAL